MPSGARRLCYCACFRCARATHIVAAALTTMEMLNGYARNTVKEEENYQCYGEVVVDGKVQKIAILFAPGSFVVILPRDAVENMSPIETDNELWNGEAKYSPTEFVLHSPTVNCLFDEDDEEVVFVRQELDE